jgi:hypothetical protein
MKKKKSKILDFSSSMQPKQLERKRDVISHKPLTKTKKKLLRFRPPKFEVHIILPPNQS